MNTFKINKEFINNINELPSDAGVYKFLNKQNTPIYIGKAKNVRKRVKSYFLNNKKLSQKVRSLKKEATFLEITLTNSEIEALILEQHLIKSFKPKYNVQFKDDKGYPWIKIDKKKDFPSINYFLGKKTSDSVLYGPYPNRVSVREALAVIQRTFKLRDCSDGFFKSRSRPCLQYEIGRCSAPCVGGISQTDYRLSVDSAERLLKGQGNMVISNLYLLMDKSSESRDYEKAAFYRDQIVSIREVQKKQSISGYQEDRDAVVLFQNSNKRVIGVTQVRGGWIISHKSFSISLREIEGKDTLEEFILSYYLSQDYCPSRILVSTPLKNKLLLQKALSEYHGKIIYISHRLRLKDKGLIEIANKNTRDIKKEGPCLSLDFQKIFRDLALIINSSSDIQRVECYDISHLSGSTPVGSCVVFGTKGKINKDYRLYNIKEELGGNDSGSMKDLVKRRFKKGNKNTTPDLILVDGGPVQLNIVNSTLKEMGFSKTHVIALSKGHKRKSQNDSIHIIGKSRINLDTASQSHKFLQIARDEAHRFAIDNLKKKRVKLLKKSSIDEIPGIGQEKRRALIRYFGSVEKISYASISELEKVPGIGKIYARSISVAFKR